MLSSGVQPELTSSFGILVSSLGCERKAYRLRHTNPITKKTPAGYTSLSAAYGRSTGWGTKMLSLNHETFGKVANDVERMTCLGYFKHGDILQAKDFRM